MGYKLAGSGRTAPFTGTDVTRTGEPWPEEWLCDVTVYLRPARGRAAVEALAAELAAAHARVPVRDRTYLQEADLASVLGASDRDRDAVVKVFSDAGIQHVHAVGTRAVHVRGDWEQLRSLFTIDRRRYQTADGVVVGRLGEIEVLDGTLAELVEAVFGLDNRRALSPYVIKSHVIKSHVIKSHVIKSHLAETVQQIIDRWVERTDGVRRWFSPAETAAWYDFPDASGSGCRIGVLAFSGQLGGTDQMVLGGYHLEHLKDYFLTDIGATTAPRIESRRIRGPGNWPGDGTSALDFTDEVMLDLAVAGSLAPGAQLTVYFSEPTEQGWVDALHHVVELDDPPDILLVCYGSPENQADGSSWTRAAIDQSNCALAAAGLRGITVVCSCGDNGAAGAPLSTRVHADFPASSPWVLGCGGTTAYRSVSEEHPVHETVWNDGRNASGGGISAVVDRPSWQPQELDIPEPVDSWRRSGFLGRGVPDVAALADPATGIPVVDAANDTVVVGGTSVSAPIWAALLARCLEVLRAQQEGAAGARLGYLTPAFYAGVARMRDVPVGDNGAYSARSGWDPCTGWGVPIGTGLSDALQGRPAVTAASRAEA